MRRITEVSGTLSLNLFLNMGTLIHVPTIRPTRLAFRLPRPPPRRCAAQKVLAGSAGSVVPGVPLFCYSTVSVAGRLWYPG